MNVDDMSGQFFHTLSSLKRSQDAVVCEMDRVLECARDYPRALERLAEFEEMLLLHLNGQNEQFYGQLRSAEVCAEKVVDFLQEDIQDLRIEFLEFLEHYPKNANPVRVRNFPAKFYAFSRKVLNRFSLEKDQIFPILAAFNK